MKLFKYAVKGGKDEITFVNSLPEEFTFEDKDGELVNVVKTGAYTTPQVQGTTLVAPDLVFCINHGLGERFCLHAGLVKGLYNHAMFFDRWSKSEGNILLNKMFAGAKNYLSILPYSQPCLINTTVNQWVMRPLHGARGMAIMKVPEGKSPEWLHQKILTHNYEGLTSVSDAFNPTHTSSEVINKVCSDGVDFVQYIPNVRSEYRLITDHEGSFSIAVKRERTMRENDMYMATGSQNDPNNVIYFDDLKEGIIDKNDLACLKQLHTYKNLPPMCSFDLFITTYGNFGFFEFCPEFGAAGIPVDWVATTTSRMFAKVAQNVMDSKKNPS